MLTYPPPPPAGLGSMHKYTHTINNQGNGGYGIVQDRDSLKENVHVKNHFNIEI